MNQFTATRLDSGVGHIQGVGTPISIIEHGSRDSIRYCVKKSAGDIHSVDPVKRSLTEKASVPPEYLESLISMLDMYKLPTQMNGVAINN